MKPLCRKQRLARIFFVLILGIMLLIGRYTYQDYGLTADEYAERTTSLSNYQHVFETLWGQSVDGLEVVRLEDHKDRYYGVALQMPMVVVEHLTGFTMPLSDVFRLRHLYTFLMCMSGWVCFWGFLRKVFKDDWLALLGFLMVVLYPRFWGEQFTNIKDMVFAAVFAASLFCTALCLEHEGKWRYELLAAFVSALCINTRFLGLVIPLMLFGYRLLRDLLLAPVWRNRGVSQLWKNVLRYTAHFLFLLLFYYLITPGAWTNPLDYIANVLGVFSNYLVWGGTVPFLGQMIRGNALPWYYIPVWVGISVPLWYLVLLISGLPLTIHECIRVKGEKTGFLLNEYRYALLCLVIAVIPVAGMLVNEVTLYNGWRHMYFIFPPLVVLILFGLRAIWRKATLLFKRILAVTLSVLMVWQCGWIVRAHPLEKLYFNEIGIPLADGMDRDSWYESNILQLQYILEHDDAHRIRVYGMEWVSSACLYFLPPEEAERFYVPIDDYRSCDYVIDVADTVEPTVFEGFTPIHTIHTIDGILVSTLYIRDEVLQERFGGQYP